MMLSLIGIIIGIALITVLINILKNWSTMINFKRLFSFLIIGATVLTVFFVFQEEEVFVIVISYTALIISSLFYGSFKKGK
jgi:hypothetical protein